MTSYPKRLIEIDLPIKKISAHARREKSIRHGHISTLHIWWARRPLAACRAVLCAALWPDPVDPLCPQAFRDRASLLINEFARKAINSKELAAQCAHDSWTKWRSLVGSGGLDSTNPAHWNVLRFALLDFIADFANWDNSTSTGFLETSRLLTSAAHESLGGVAGSRPLVLDPFAGGGAIPLEALRIGADAFASDVNPVAATLNKLMLEHLAQAPEEKRAQFELEAAQIKERVFRKLGHYYERATEQAVAYIWARVIRCEGPGCGVEIPLLTSPWLCKLENKYVWFECTSQQVDRKVSYSIRTSSSNPKPQPTGTSSMGSATCPVCGFTTPKKAVYRQLIEQDGGAHSARCMAVVTATGRGASGRKYDLPTADDLRQVEKARFELASIRESLPHERINDISPGKFGSGIASPTRIGCVKFTDLFAARQLLLLDAFSREIAKVEDRTIQLLLACALDRLADYNSAHCRWAAPGEFIGNTFGRQAISIVWMFAEVNPFEDASGNWDGAISWISRVFEHICRSDLKKGQAAFHSATDLPLPDDSVDALVTDPPYYGAIMYGDLSDYFYIWLKRCVGKTFPDLFGPALVAKEAEIVATPTSKGPAGEKKDATFFEAQMHLALENGRRLVRSSGIAIVVFAHKSTAGWEAMLSALISAGWVVTASWPVDTERQGRTNAQGTAALGSSVHLVCRPREYPTNRVLGDEIGDWRDVLAELPVRVHEWIPRLQQEGVVGADAIFACLGPALEIFSRHERVEKPNGDHVSLKEYLEYVWAAVSKEAISMIFAGADTLGFEEDARLTAMWLWTLSAGPSDAKITEIADSEESETESEETSGKPAKLTGFTLEYDAARKIAQGLGAHLELLASLVEIRGENARLLPVVERTKTLFGKEGVESPAPKQKKSTQLSLPGLIEELEQAEAGWTLQNAAKAGTTTLDRLHQAMILFAAGRGEGLRRFLVDDGVGKEQRFWSLAQSLCALYPSGTDERRWSEGVLARKKGLGL